MAKTTQQPDYDEMMLALQAAKAAGAICLRYEIGDRVLVFELSDGGAHRPTPLEEWRERRGPS